MILKIKLIQSPRKKNKRKEWRAGRVDNKARASVWKKSN